MDQVAQKPKLNVIWGIVVLAVIVLLITGYLIWKKTQKTPEEKAVETVEKTLESAVGGTLPDLTPLTNPLEKLPEINPVEKVNPFKGLQTNPFR